MRSTPTEAADLEIALLRDVDAGLVEDNADFTPMLLVDGERVSVAQSIWALERRRLVEQPFASRVWQLTDAGRAVLEEADR